MFERLKLWLIGDSGLRQATREAAREATREGLAEGFRLGVEDFIAGINGPRPEPQTIEVRSNGNGRHHPLTAAELRGLRKADLLELAEERGLKVDESWTVNQLRDELLNWEAV